MILLLSLLPVCILGCRLQQSAKQCGGMSLGISRFWQVAGLLQAEHGHCPYAPMCCADMADSSDEHAAHCASGWSGRLVWWAVPCITSQD